MNTSSSSSSPVKILRPPENQVATTNLRPPENQVAGHSAADGKLGPLVDSNGFFYKPLQSDSRGEHEVAFYSAFTSAINIPDAVRRFFPEFHGVAEIPASDGSGDRSHLVLGDLVAAYSNPCVADFKIGSRTWYPTASESYISKCLEKDRKTTSVTLGFRVSGMKVNFGQSDTAEVWCPDRDIVRCYAVSDAKHSIRQFVSLEPLASDTGLATKVYGGPHGVLAQLRELKAWFEEQTIFHFYSASVFVAFEKGGDMPIVKLMDFSHVVDADGVIDHNFLGGLCSLIKCIVEVLNEEKECSMKSSNAKGS